MHGFCFKQCLSMIQPILLLKLKRLRSTSPTYLFIYKGSTANKTYFNAGDVAFVARSTYSTYKTTKKKATVQFVQRPFFVVASIVP